MTETLQTRITAYNRRLAKMAVQCSADSFMDNQGLFLRINICGKIATFAKRQTVIGHAMMTVPNPTDSYKNTDNE